MSATRSRHIHQIGRCPWDAVTTAELAECVSVSIQTLANWRIRGKGPPPLPVGAGRGNRVYYRIYDVLAWIEDRPAWRAVSEWIADTFGVACADEEATWRTAETIEALGIVDRKHFLRSQPVGRPQSPMK